MGIECHCCSCGREGSFSTFLSLGFEDDDRGRFRRPIARGYENGNCNFQGFVDGYAILEKRKVLVRDLTWFKS